MKRQRLYSIDGIKVIGLLLVFWSHCPCLPQPFFALGDLGTKLLIVISGFCAYYSYSAKSLISDYTTSLTIVKKKLSLFWPLHFITFLFSFFVLSGYPLLSKKKIIYSILNLLLVQAWSPYTTCAFSFNGVSWFLSALLFCYFLIPFLLRFTNTIRKTVVAFILTLGVRYFFDWTMNYIPYTFFDINLHYNPFICLIDFSSGFFICPIFILLQKKIEQNFCKSKTKYLIVFSILELGVIIFTPLLIWSGVNQLNPVIFCILSYLPLIFVFAFNNGILSKIFSSNPFRLFTKIQFEFFMFHQVVYFTIAKIFPVLNTYIFIASTFFITILLSVLYTRFLSKKLSNLFVVVTRKIETTLN